MKRKSKVHRSGSAEEKITSKTARHSNDGRRRTAKLAAIVHAGQFSTLTSNQLATKLLSAVKAVFLRLKELEPLVTELRFRFATLRKDNSGGQILGCRTWQDFCDKRLHYTDRHVRRLIEGKNPASETYRNAKPRKGAKKPGQASPRAGSAPSAGWNDQQFVDACVGFVKRTLQPLKADASRSERVARKIAEKIISAFSNDE